MDALSRVFASPPTGSEIVAEILPTDGRSRPLGRETPAVQPELPPFRRSTHRLDEEEVCFGKETPKRSFYRNSLNFVDIQK